MTGTCCGVCFCEQKTAYEVRISDWSSDVGSSDLDDARQLAIAMPLEQQRNVQHHEPARAVPLQERPAALLHGGMDDGLQRLQFLRMAKDRRAQLRPVDALWTRRAGDRQSTRLNSSH